MLVDITSISRGIGDHLSLEWVANPDELNLEKQDQAEFLAVSFTGRLENLGKGRYNLTGEVTAETTTPCALCLTPVANPLRVDVDEQYSSGSLETNTGLDEEGYRYEGHVISILQALHDNLLLAAPHKVVCSPNCQGLCPICGQNQNLGHCKCADDHPSPVSPFEQLKTLL